jgi:signal peptidase II
MIYFLIIVLFFLLDYTIKLRVVKNYKSDTYRKILNDRLILRYSRNYGAILNLGEKRPAVIKMASLATLLSVLYYLYDCIRHNYRAASLGLSLICAGGLSNTCDRLKRGFVVDYFSFNHRKISHIVFNLGDIFIFTGIILSLPAALAALLRRG